MKKKNSKKDKPTKKFVPAKTIEGLSKQVEDLQQSVNDLTKDLEAVKDTTENLSRGGCD